MKFDRRLLLVATLWIAGCADLTSAQLVQLGELGVAIAKAGASAGPGAAPAGPTEANPQAPRLPIETGPATARATADRPDDSPLNQAHVVYFLPADAADEQLDTNGGITGTLAVGAKWMRGQTGGPTLRIDQFEGKPDVTFFRSAKDTVAIGLTASAIRTEVERELVAAGFDNPDKTYCALYAGSSALRTDQSTTGISSGRYSTIFFNQCNPCTGDVYRRGMSFKTALTILHETFHSLGFGHVTDDENDIMSASGESLYLDRGHDTYYGAHRPGVPDLADSPYLQP